MISLDLIFFGLMAILALVGAIITVAARNPIRGAMGLLATIAGIAGMFLLLSAEFLSAIQIIVYAGAVVILFIFVIMLLGPSATSTRDAKTAVPRYVGAGLFGASAFGALYLIAKVAGPVTTLRPAPAGFGSIESVGRELFTVALTPFEVSGALLLVAVVGAVAVARGKQVDPTLQGVEPGGGTKAASKGPVPHGAALAVDDHGPARAGAVHAKESVS